MLLDRIEIDHHGPLSRVEIGPLSHHLNVILGPAGSGKTAISRFVRDSLIQRNYPTGMLSSSAGRVVWVGDHGWIHVRREQDGTPGGRRDIQFQSRGDSSTAGESYRDGWFDEPSLRGHGHPQSFAARSLQSLQIPESIVDGVMVDTLVSNVSHVVAACLQAGLDRDGLAPLPLRNETSPYAQFDGPRHAGSVQANEDQRQHRAWRTELADVEARLAEIENNRYAVETVEVEPSHDGDNADWVNDRQRDELLRQRQACWDRRESILRRELDRRTTVFDEASSERSWQIRVDQDRLRSLHASADSLRARATELQRWIAELDRQSSDYAHRSHAYGPLNDPRSVAPRRDDLLQLDDEIISLRQTLAEIEGIRETVRRYAPRGQHDWSSDWIEQRRYTHFVSAIDHYRGDRAWEDFYQNAYRPLHEIDDVSLRMEAAMRQIDSLLHRLDSVDYHTPAHAHAPATHRPTLTNSLRQLREQFTHSRATSDLHLDQCAREMTATLHQLLATRDAVAGAMGTHGRTQVRPSIDWVAQRHDAIVRLRDLESQLRSVLDETARLRRRMRYLPIADASYPIGMSGFSQSIDSFNTVVARESRLTAADRSYLADLEAQLRYLDDELRLLTVRSRRAYPRRPVVRQAIRGDVHSPLWDELNRRRHELIENLRRQRPVARRESSLREMACGWLVRLSGGRHRQIDWSRPYGPATDERQVIVRIDGQEERGVSAATRAVASLAVRMAAGELLSRMGRAVPLVIETHRELLQSFGGRDPLSIDAYRQWTGEGLTADSIASALCDYAAGSRQLLLLTSDASLADWVTRGGGRMFRLTTRPIVHAHRPMWRSGAHADRYVGPHGLDGTSGLPRDGVSGEFFNETANAEFERAWIESSGLQDDTFHDAIDREPASPQSFRHGPIARDADDWLRRRHPAVATDLPASGTQYRDGFYTTQQTTSAPVHSHVSVVNAANPVNGALSVSGAAGGAENPFFLTVDSPIDAAPSIDAVAAARLRRIGISHITHLMNQDSNRLSDTLGLAGVDARTIRRWQSECRLMCRVPQLRGFDARVLVGCGITDPAQLAAIAPSDLLDRVKTFLATEQGQRILLSGTSYELSRITSWIASANQSVHARRQVRSDRDDSSRSRTTIDGRPARRRIDRDETPVTLYREADDDFDQRRYEVRSPRRSREASATPRRDREDSRPAQAPRTTVTESNRQREPRTTRPERIRTERDRSERDRSERDHTERAPREARVSSPSVRGERAASTSSSSTSELRFYLERSSDVVDAPSIGPRMAERLNQIGIVTVDDLLKRDASAIASGLGHRRVTTEIVRQWQQQTTLVCRVPMMRGHDAQFLVAVGVTSPEQLSTSSPATLFPKILAMAQSTEGKRIVRGGQMPDLAEVTSWIEYAKQNRSLQAA